MRTSLITLLTAGIALFTDWKTPLLIIFMYSFFYILVDLIYLAYYKFVEFSIFNSNIQEENQDREIREWVWEDYK